METGHKIRLLGGPRDGEVIEVATLEPRLSLPDGIPKVEWRSDSNDMTMAVTLREAIYQNYYRNTECGEQVYIYAFSLP